jgi:2-oxoglutarate dehydrogenase E2 component (dihydrolipoamide succinyltransferase)
MAIDITVPSVGESISEGTLSHWLKADGESVKIDEPIFELETEKATAEVPAPASGILRILVAEGSTIGVGSVVGRVEEEVAGSAAQAKPAPPSAAKTSPQAAFPPDGKPSVPAASRAASARPDGPQHPAPVHMAAAAGEVLLSPAARRLAEEAGIDPRRLSGTGPGNRITKEDVLAYQAGQSSAAPAKTSQAPSGDGSAAHPGETRQRMSSIRQRIAERMLASQKSTATLSTFSEADLQALMNLRGRYKEAFLKKHGVNLGFMSFFVKACVEGLKAFPIVNARIDGPDIVYEKEYHIGVAVSTDKGLMVPVVRDADQLSLAQIEARIAELATKARDGKITVPDLQGGTFTITNGGIFGSLLSTPILNPPQSAILGMHTIQKRPVALADEVVIRPMMYLALSYDHRLIDGRDAVLFLIRVKECIEDPDRLLLEV